MKIVAHWRALLGAAATVLGVAAATLAGATPASATPSGGLPGIDVSHYQGSINWTSVKNAGKQFAYIKATEGTSTIDAQFGNNYPNAYYAGLIRGAYHFARFSSSTGAAQADYFWAHGGKWSADGKTLPGMLDLEASCSGYSHASIVSWISSFVNEYHAKTGRWAVLYTSPSWWSTCTGGSSAFAANDPLYVAHYTSAGSPTIPGGFSFYTFWQWSSSGSVSGISGAVDLDVFNGSAARLLALANNTA
jgi:GH25 family lysozyme M1 (1,4-beta-N-acetylmuramidase)